MTKVLHHYLLRKDKRSLETIFVVCFWLPVLFSFILNAEILFSPHTGKRRILTENDSQLLDESEDECKMTSSSTRLEWWWWNWYISKILDYESSDDDILYEFSQIQDLWVNKIGEWTIFKIGEWKPEPSCFSKRTGDNILSSFVILWLIGRQMLKAYVYSKVTGRI